MIVKAEIMKNIIKLMFVVVTTVALSGCASIFSGSSQTVNIATSDGSTVEANIVSKSGVQQVTLPSVVSVKRAKEDICVNIKESEKNRKSTQMVASNLNLWFFGNFIFGGLLGSSTDAITGAMWEYDSFVTVPVYEK